MAHNTPEFDHLVRRIHSSDREERARAVELLGLLDDRGAVEPLCTALSDPDWNVRAVAASALSRVGDERAVPALCAALADHNWTVRPRAAAALGSIRHPDAVYALAHALRNDMWLVRKAAAAALGSIPCPEAAQALSDAENDPDAAVREAVRSALQAQGLAQRGGNVPSAAMPEPELVYPPPKRRETSFQRFLANRVSSAVAGDPALDLLVGRFRQADAQAQAQIASQLAQVVPDGIWALCEILLNCTESQARSVLRALGNAGLLAAMATCAALGHDARHVRHAAADALELMTDQGAAVSLCLALKEEDDPYVRSRTAFALARLGNADSIPTLLEALKTGDEAASFAAHALIKIGSEAVPALCEALHERRVSVRELAIDALVKIGATNIAHVHAALQDDLAYVRICAADILIRLNDESSIARVCCAYEDVSMSVRATIGNYLAKQDADRLILAILREPAFTGAARLNALNGVLERSNRRRSRLARFGDAQRCCSRLTGRTDLDASVAIGARAVLAELDRRSAGKTLLRAGSIGEDTDGLLRAASASDGDLPPDELLRAAPDPG